MAPRDEEIAQVQPKQALPADEEAVGMPELQISYPDAALPGGQAQSVVALQFDKNGWVQVVELEPGALPDIFAEAVTAAFMGQQFGSSRGRTLKLCLQVEFKEGEEPRWQILEDPVPKSAGICKSV